MYIQLDVDYWEHPKTMLLQSLIGQWAAAVPPKMWSWAAKYARDGVIPCPMLNVAMGMHIFGFSPDSGLSDAMLEAGFIEPNPENPKTVRIVNWGKRTGNFMERYEAKKERMKDYQEEKRRVIRGEKSKVSGYYPDTIPKVSSPPVAISPRDEVVRQLFQLAQSQKVAAVESTLRGRLESWVARIGADAVQEKLSHPSAVGKTVNELQDLWFPKVQERPKAPAPKSFKCGTCSDAGYLVDPRDGSKSPCSCTRKRS